MQRVQQVNISLKKANVTQNIQIKNGIQFFIIFLQVIKEVENLIQFLLGFGIEVVDRYKDMNWISSDGSPGEWAGAYHGFGCQQKSEQIKEIIKTIIHDNSKPESGQACASVQDKRHKGQIYGV